ncbi:MAG: dTDP-4-dehydrorhamnose 3,5-epimerase family protein [Candidatus Woesebacteria bacterium]|jgi:dTDP-4-dehydrorhamnose 3,5-epimerase
MSKKIKFYQAKKKLQISDNIYKTSINGLYYIVSRKYTDERGFFSEIVKLPELEKALKIKFSVKQFNYSYSKTKVVRGMHAEGWNKLVLVSRGLAFSALADVNPKSKTFGKVEYFKLGANQKPGYANGLFISQGIANSLCALKGPVNYIYLVDRLYCQRDKKDDQAISIFDPDLKITWPFPDSELIISKRDKNSVTLRELYPEKFK